MSRLLALYPSAWRTHYGAEMARLLEDAPPSLGDRVDLLRGAADAWLHPGLVPGSAKVPLGHRAPGVAAVSVGILLLVWLAAAYVGPPALSDVLWAASPSILLVLMAMSLVSIVTSLSRRVVVGGPLVAAALILVAQVLPDVVRWPAQGAAFAIVLGVLVVQLAARAGLGGRGRAVSVIAGLVAPLATELAIAFVNPPPPGTGGGMLVAALYAGVWVILGARMAIRGAPVWEAAAPQTTGVPA